ncbi:glycosyltransferase family protein [Psychrobacter sanguinis]|uniref:hypothetical protein n=1 Tax=Psychrobacter sanguinis TaxID=861445 RepID=UPI00191A4174|nr:hypothetical protein [Psychrobacter sanguinis]MCC3345964.1 hypothetical protein [Psychrobacter sanguinis]
MINYQNILLVSNNALSETHNNGKTLSSLVRDYPSSNLSQLYFSDETPLFNDCNRFFKISDTDILRRLDGRAIAEPYPTQESILKKNKTVANTLKNSQTARLLREAAWRYLNFNKTKLFEWLEKQPPDVIFFCAGDSLFAYNIVNKIMNKYNCKLIVYITDDYILPRLSASLSWWIRRNLIFNNMEHIIEKCDLLLTISDSMRIKYKEIFNKDSLVFFNKPENLKINRPLGKSEKIELIYAGGFHFNRWKVLRNIALAIQEYNKKNKKQAFLNIYSNNLPNKRILNKINVENASKYSGSLNSSELKIELNRADILVHVEAFDFRSKASTMLSLSTKIPEYLSIKHTILAIGPKEVASIKHLEQYPQAYIISELKRISEDVNKILKIKSEHPSAYTIENNDNVGDDAYYIDLDMILDAIR